MPVQEEWEKNWIDYYQLLGLDQNANLNTIKKRIRKLLMQNHSDNFAKDSEDRKAAAEEMTRTLLEAKKILLNPDKKKKYDAAWDEMKNSNAHETTTQDNSKAMDDEGLEKEYTADEKRWAKRVALKEFIKEELKKVDLLMEAKSDLLYKGLSFEVDVREYYNSVKGFLSVGNEFLIHLKKLAEEACKYGLLEEEEIIYDMIANLSVDFKNIPLTPIYAKAKITKETYTNRIIERLVCEVENSKEINEKLHSILMYVRTGEITPLDYKNILFNVLYDAKNCKNSLNQLIQIAYSLGLQKFHSIGLEALKTLVSNMEKMSEDFDTIKVRADLEEKKENISNLILECEKLDNKIKKVLLLLKKHPKSSHFEKGCQICLSRIEEKVNELNQVQMSVTRPDFSIKNEEKLKALILEASECYKRSQLNRTETDKFFETIGINNEITEEMQNKILGMLSKDSMNILEKNKVFALFVEIQEMIEKCKVFGGVEANESLKDLCQNLSVKINEFQKLENFIHKVLNEYKTKTNVNTTNNNVNEDDIKKMSTTELLQYLTQLLAELKKKENCIRLYSILSCAFSMGTLGSVTLQNVDTVPEVLFTTTLALLTISSGMNLFNNVNDYNSLQSKRNEVRKALNRKLAYKKKTN